MEYNYYLEQKYLYAGRIEVRILTAAQAEVLGYEDDYVRTATDHKLYVNGYDSLEAVHSYCMLMKYLLEPIGCILGSTVTVEQETRLRSA